MLTDNEKELIRELAIFIKKERNAQGISRDALAEVVNLSTRAIEEFETRFTNIGGNKLLNILLVLNIDFNEVRAITKRLMNKELSEKIDNLGKHWNG